MITTPGDPQFFPTMPPADRLRSTMAAVRVSTKWLAAGGNVTRELAVQAGEVTGGKEQFVVAEKRLSDICRPAFKAATAIHVRAIAYWDGVTLPYPELGIRLIRQDQVAQFDRRFTRLNVKLVEVIERLSEHIVAPQLPARAQLDGQFNTEIYRESLREMFSFSWDFPNVEPPDYLRQLSPELFQQQQLRVSSRFAQAVRMAERAFVAELESLTVRLTKRLAGASNEKFKVFCDLVLGKLRAFFRRFRQLNIRSNEQLDSLVDQAQQIIRGVDSETLRDNPSLRDRLFSELAVVHSALLKVPVSRS